MERNTVNHNYICKALRSDTMQHVLACIESHHKAIYNTQRKKCLHTIQQKYFSFTQFISQLCSVTGAVKPKTN
jgi:hypothetical protein